MLAYQLNSVEVKNSKMEVSAVVVKEMKKIFKGFKANKYVEAMNCVLVELNEKEQMVVTYTNSELIIQKKFEVIDAVSSHTKSFLLPIQALKDIKYIKNHETFEFEIVEKNLLSIKRDGVETTITTLDIEDYADLSSVLNDDYTEFENENDESNLLTRQDLDVFIKAGKSVSTSETRPILSQIALVNGEAISTDSHRLFKGETVLKKDGSTHILPPIIFDRMKDLTDKHQLYSLSYNRKNEIKIETDHVTIINRAVDGNYPVIDRLIPNEFKLEFQIEKIHQVMTVLNSQKKAMVKMTYMKDEQKIELKVSDIDKKNQTIATIPVNVIDDQFINDDFKITFSAPYFKEAIEQMDKEYINLKFISNMRPFVVNNNKNNDMALILPIRTY